MCQILEVVLPVMFVLVVKEAEKLVTHPSRVSPESSFIHSSWFFFLFFFFCRWRSADELFISLVYRLSNPGVVRAAVLFTAL